MKPKKKKLKEFQMKQIASWAVTHPDLTHDELAQIFECTIPQARYALQKYAELSELAQNTQRGKQVLQNLVKDTIDDEVEVLNSQVRSIIAALEVDQDMAISTRLQHLNNIMTIRQKIQAMSLSTHMKNVDAKIVAAIVRRFMPNASDDDIVKIYQEEKAKL